MSRNDDKLRVQLEARTDQNSKTYYFGKLKFPGTLDCTKGIVFIIFTSEGGSEELQIAAIEPKEQLMERKEPKGFIPQR